MIFSAVYGASAYAAIPYAARMPAVFSASVTESVTSGDGLLSYLLVPQELFTATEHRAFTIKVSQAQFTFTESRSVTAPAEGRIFS